MHSFGTLMQFIWRSGKRAAVFVVGVALLTVGLIMFVTPGPGIVLVVAGLAVLATEFAWAEHLLDKAKEQATRAGQSAQRLPGVATVTAAAGRLVPRRWRPATATATSVVVTETLVDGVVTDQSITATATTVTAIEADPSAPGGPDAPMVQPPDGDRATGHRPTRGPRRIPHHPDHDRP